MTDPASRRLKRLPLLALALVALLAGLWAGLLRLGLDIPQLRPALAAEHGPLLVLGFLGTQIGLERAVALRRSWAYAAPAAAAAGAAWLIVGLPADAGRAWLALGGGVLVVVFVALHRLQPSWHNAVMGLGAGAWLVGALVWLGGGLITTVVPWLVAFLVLTIVGERLELSRLRRLSPSARNLLLAAVCVFLAGVALSGAQPGVGVRLGGAGLVAQALWLARNDVARRTIRVRGATRYMAIALLAGYVWLAVGGIVWLTTGTLSGGGFAYDAMLHAIFLGFVFSMVFAHAPVIVPAVLGVPLPFTPAMYGPLAMLHVSLAIRLLGDAGANVTAWQWGGALNEAAILGFLAVAAGSVMRATSAQRSGRRQPRRPSGRPGRPSDQPADRPA